MAEERRRGEEVVAEMKVELKDERRKGELAVAEERRRGEEAVAEMKVELKDERRKGELAVAELRKEWKEERGVEAALAQTRAANDNKSMIRWALFTAGVASRHRQAVETRRNST